MAGRPEDKRDTERIEILGELNGEVMVFQPMNIKEISHGSLMQLARVSVSPEILLSPG